MKHCVECLIEVCKALIPVSLFFSLLVNKPVLDFQKKMLGPAGPQVFIFGRQNKSSSRQKLNLRTNQIQ